MADRQTDVPSTVERVREDAAEYQTDTPTDWTSPDERRRESRDRRVGSFTKLLEHDPETGLLTKDGVDQHDRLAKAIENNDGALLDDVRRANTQAGDESNGRK